MTRRRIVWAGGAAAALLLLAAAGVWTLRSEWFREQVRLKIVSVAETATGGRVELERFRYDWGSMTARVEGFTLHGTEGAEREPLLRIPELELAIHVRSLLRRDVELRSLVITRPAVHVYVAEDGTTNLPQPKRRASEENVIEQLLKLRIGRLAVTEGLLHYGARTVPVEARAEGVDAELTLDGRDAIAFLLAARQVDAWGRAYGFESRGRLEAQRVTVERAAVTIGTSRAELSGTVEDFKAPRISAQIKAEAALREWPELVLDGGRARVEAEITWSEAEGPAAAGTLQGDGLALLLEDFEVRGAALAARFSWKGEELQLTDAALSALKGRWRGRARVAGWRDLEVAGEAEGLSVEAIASAAKLAEFPWDASLSGPVSVKAKIGEKGFTDTAARADVRLAPVEGHVALEGRLAGEWRQRGGVLELEPSHVATPSSRVTAAGVIGERLEAAVFSTNPQDLEPVLALAAGEPVKLPVRLRGGALEAHATVTGPLDSPGINGTLSASQAWWDKIHFSSVAAEFRLSGHELNLVRLRLEQNGSRVEGRVRLGLQEWKLPDDAALEATLQASGIRLDEAARQAGYDGAIGGTVNASLEAAGTLERPRGALRWQARQVVIGKEKFAKLSGHLKAESAEALRVKGGVELDEAELSVDGSYRHPPGDWSTGEASVSVRIAGDWDLSATGPVEVSGSSIAGSFPLVRDERITTMRR